MRAGSREEVHEIYCAPRRPHLDDMTVAFLLTLYLVEEEGGGEKKRKAGPGGCPSDDAPRTVSFSDSGGSGMW